MNFKPVMVVLLSPTELVPFIFSHPALREIGTTQILAIAFKKGMTMPRSISPMKFSKIEEPTIVCAQKLFDRRGLNYAPEKVKYHVVKSCDQMIELVK